MKAQLSPRRRRKPGGCGTSFMKGEACESRFRETMKNGGARHRTSPAGRRACVQAAIPQGESEAMNIESLHLGMKLRHPQYGVGVVRSLTEHTAEIAFEDAPRTIAPASSDLQPAEATATVSELQVPLANLIREAATATVEALGLEKRDVVVEGLANRWHNGTLLLQPSDASLQAKDVPIETFFHKIVMIRNNLRVLEQKVNASEKLSDADKFELQQYITRCYGSLTTFNILFKSKDDQFRSGSA